MATFTSGVTRATSDLITAAIWNNNMGQGGNVDYFKDVPTLAGLIVTGVTSVVNINVTGVFSSMNTCIFNKSVVGEHHILKVAGSEKASYGTKIFTSSLTSGSVGFKTQEIFEFGIGDSIKMYINTAGDWRPGSDNTVNLGTATSGRWKDVFAVTKTSVLDVPWTKSKTVLIGVVEGPEYRIHDQGTARLDSNGEATVQLDPHYVAVVNLKVPWQVLTSGAKVTVKSSLGWFMLQGDPGGEIDWQVSCVRAGFENIRWRDPGVDPEPRGLREPARAIQDKHPLNNTDQEEQQ
jgi:hypothetical protein